LNSRAYVIALRASVAAELREEEAMPECTRKDFSPNIQAGIPSLSAGSSKLKIFSTNC
jgi:hypothetical protein